jgi:hypothetical protein
MRFHVQEGNELSGPQTKKEGESIMAIIARFRRMPEYQKAMAPLIVPGSHRWEIFRIQEG